MLLSAHRQRTRNSIAVSAYVYYGYIHVCTLTSVNLTILLDSFISLLIRLLLELSATLNSQNTFSKFASSVVIEILLPNLVWKAGR